MLVGLRHLESRHRIAIPCSPYGEGHILLIVEAMKMENELRAPRDGGVQTIHVGPGDSVDKGTPLVTLS